MELYIVRRLSFLFLLWLPLVNILTSTLFLLIPYWIFTGKIIYECKYFNAINDWHYKLKSN